MILGEGAARGGGGRAASFGVVSPAFGPLACLLPELADQRPVAVLKGGQVVSGTLGPPL
jgi:hypothetical protein